MKSPANGVPPAERSADSTYQPRGSSGILPWPRIRSRRSTSIDSPWAPATPRRVRRNDVSRMMKPAVKSTSTAPPVRTLIVVCRAIAITTSTSMNTTNHGRWRGLRTRLPTSIGSTSELNGT